MNYVADAHAIIWYFIDDSRLSQNARQAFEQTITAGVIIIPTIVLAEIMYISQRGRISMTFEETLSHTTSSLASPTPRRKGMKGRKVQPSVYHKESQS